MRASSSVKTPFANNWIYNKMNQILIICLPTYGTYYVIRWVTVSQNFRSLSVDEFIIRAVASSVGRGVVWAPVRIIGF